MNDRRILKFKNKLFRKPFLIILSALVFTTLIGGIGYIAGNNYLIKRQEATASQSISATQTPEPTIIPSPTPTTASPTPKPTVKPQPTASPKPLFDFTKDQYEVSISNVDYGNESNIGVMADIKIKNISITPFITKYDLSDCKLVKNGNPADNFYLKGFMPTLEKGILPGETMQTRFQKNISGSEYDSSGNKILPTADLRVKTCIFRLETANTSNIESTTVVFP